MQKALCDKDTLQFLHSALKGDTRYKGRHCLIIWDSTNGTKDALGSVLALTDGSGNVTDTYDYGEYGVQTATTGSSYNPYRFTGQQYDADSGLYYLRARYYDPETGRFVSVDPISEILEKYVYVKDNPVNYVDPNGLKRCTTFLECYTKCLNTIFFIPSQTMITSVVGGILWLILSWRPHAPHYMESVGQWLTGLIAGGALTVTQAAALGTIITDVAGGVAMVGAGWLAGSSIGCAAVCAGDPSAYDT